MTKTPKKAKKFKIHCLGCGKKSPAMRAGGPVEVPLCDACVQETHLLDYVDGLMVLWSAARTGKDVLHTFEALLSALAKPCGCPKCTAARETKTPTVETAN